MKSQRQDEKNKTSCKECVLAVYDGNTQTSCLANRVEKLEHFEAYDEEKEFFVIERLCNYYRNNKDIYLKDNGDVDLDKIKKETRLSFDIIFLCNHIDSEYSDYILDLYSYLNENYEDKFSIQLMYAIATKEQTQIIQNLKNKINCYVTFYADDIYLHSMLTKTQKSYHTIISKESRPNKNFTIRLNRLVNDEMEKIVTFVDNGVYTISNLAYKVVSFQQESTVYNDIVNSIKEKTKETNLHYE